MKPHLAAAWAVLALVILAVAVWAFLQSLDPVVLYAALLLVGGLLAGSLAWARRRRPA